MGETPDIEDKIGPLQVDFSGIPNYVQLADKVLVQCSNSPAKLAALCVHGATVTSQLKREHKEAIKKAQQIVQTETKRRQRAESIAAELKASVIKRESELEGQVNELRTRCHLLEAHIEMLDEQIKTLQAQKT